MKPIQEQKEDTVLNYDPNTQHVKELGRFKNTSGEEFITFEVIDNETDTKLSK